MHSSRMHTARSSSRQLCVWGGEGSASVHVGIHPPGCGPGDPPSCGARDWLRCGPGDPPGKTPQPLPWVWAWRPPKARPLNPPWVWAWRPPKPDPSSSLLSVGLETCKAWWDTPPRRPARHAGIPAARHAGIPLSPCGQTDTCKNITFANFVCGR